MEDTQGARRQPLLSVRQVAVMLGICTATVYEHCAKGRLRHTRVASAIRIASSDLEEFVELRSQPKGAGVPRLLSLLAPRPNEPSAAYLPGGDAPSSIEEFPTHSSLPGKESGGEEE